MRRAGAVKHLAYGGRAARRREQVAEAFVCNCSPAQLLAALEGRYPVLRDAADVLTYEDVMRRGHPVGQRFFVTLGQLYQQPPPQQLEHLFVTSLMLFPLLGDHARTDAIEWEDPLPDSDAREILRSNSAYVAAVVESDLQFLLSRERLARAVARESAARDAS